MKVARSHSLLQNKTEAKNKPREGLFFLCVDSGDSNGLISVGDKISSRFELIFNY